MGCGASQPKAANQVVGCGKTLISTHANNCQAPKDKKKTFVVTMTRGELTDSRDDLRCNTTSNQSSSVLSNAGHEASVVVGEPPSNLRAFVFPSIPTPTPAMSVEANSRSSSKSNASSFKKCREIPSCFPFGAGGDFTLGVGPTTNMSSSSSACSSIINNHPQVNNGARLNTVPSPSPTPPCIHRCRQPPHPKIRRRRSRFTTDGFTNTRDNDNGHVQQHDVAELQQYHQLALISSASSSSSSTSSLTNIKRVQSEGVASSSAEGTFSPLRCSSWTTVPSPPM